MNVPLKKRHNYGINGSASSLNEPSAKRLHSSHSNYEDSEYEQQSSNMDDSSINGPATLGRSIKVCNKKPHQYLSIGEKAVPADNQTTAHKSTTVSSSSSVIMTSSASNHDDSTSSTSDSDSSGSSRSSANEECSDVQSVCDPLTEDALMQHNAEFEPMNSKERIQFWNIADEFSEIEDNFDEQCNFSKPIRSERVQKRMYKKPAPIVSTSSRKSKKENKSRKTDEKPSNSAATTKKSKTETKEADKSPLKTPPKPESLKQKPSEISKKIPTPTPTLTPTNGSLDLNGSRELALAVEQEIVDRQPLPQKPVPLKMLHTNNSIVELRPDDRTSAIKFRVSYGKEAQCRQGHFKIPTTPYNLKVSCANCCQHVENIEKVNGSISTTSSTEMPLMTGNREEFYKYLGIDTNPPQEKTPPAISPTESNAMYNHRRSLRVFIQQKQNEFTRNEKVSKSPDKLRNSKSPSIHSNGPNNESIDSNAPYQMGKTSENGQVSPDDDADSPQSNGTTRKMKLMSSHIKQRHSYEPTSSTDVNGLINNVSSDSFKETEIECDVPDNARQLPNNLASNRFGETSGTTNVERSRVARVQKRKILLPSPMMLTEMFKRYKQCFRQGFVRQQMRQQAVKRMKKRQTKSSATEVQISNTNIHNATAENPDNTQPLSSACDELATTFSPTSITHSNASSDSAIVVHPNNNELCPPSNITLISSGSIQWNRDLANHIDKSQFRNPLDPKNGPVLAILTHSVSPKNDDVIVVIQESQISYWYSTAKILSMFGVARSWIRICEITRVNTDKEVDALYQHRLIDLGETFPVYVEMRANESAPDEFRQSYLTFVYLNVYHVKPDEKNQPQMILERVHLDTIKGFANSIYYTALKTSPSVLMTWTEQNVNNQTRCGIVKYTLKTPTLDNIEDIFDYSYMQHDINTLFAINDYHVVGCGDRTVSMWDHRNGNLLIDIEIELPTIGHNIGCYTVGDDVPEYMLLVQLTSADESQKYDKQLKVIAVQTVSPYNFRTLHTHNIPNGFGKIRSIFNRDDMLTITFGNGSMMFLNIASPHTIYSRNIEPVKQPSQVNGINSTKCGEITANQLFAQSNGQVIELNGERVATKSVWEYFVEKNSTQKMNQLV